VPEVPVRWVLDTSAVINLLGSGAGGDLLRALPYQAAVADRVHRELLYHPVEGLALAETIDDWLQRRYLEVIRLSEDVLARYLEIGSFPPPNHLDDGEAASIALAEALGAPVVLDERRARRVVAEQLPGLEVQSSAGLFRLIADIQALDSERLCDALFQALYRARMRVVPESLLDWVVHTIGPERAARCHSLPKRLRG